MKEHFVSLGSASEAIVWDILWDLPHACIINKSYDGEGNWYEVGVPTSLSERKIEEYKIQFEHWGEEEK